jgi:ribosome-binding ATPase
MRAGIIGLPQSGKTSLFKILTHAQVATGFGGNEAHLGVAHVPDRRLDELARLFNPKKTTHATIEFMDVPALSKENLREPSYLGNLRNVDALVHVVRAFGEEADPPRDTADVDLELILSDLGQSEKRLERLEKDLKKMRSADLEHEFEVLQKARAFLEQERPLRELELDAKDKKRIRGFMFLSEKPMLYVLNAGEEDAPELERLEERYHVGGRPNTEVTAISGKVEAELAELPEEEAAEYMASYGLKESGLDRLVRATYRLMGFLSFFTVSEEECRAWTLRRGQTAVEAAGAIHTDLARHFIRAEVVNWSELLEAGSMGAARERGQLRLEGKEYPVHDGQIVHIRHSA